MGNEVCNTHLAVCIKLEPKNTIPIWSLKTHIDVLVIYKTCLVYQLFYHTVMTSLFLAPCLPRIHPCPSM